MDIIYVNYILKGDFLVMTKKKLVSLFMAMVMSFSIVAQAALPVMAADENGDGQPEIITPVDEGTGETQPEPTPSVEQEQGEMNLMTVTEADASGTLGDNIVWSLTGGVLTIECDGEMADFDNEGYVGFSDLIQTSAPWFEYNEQITSVVFTEGITRIGAFAFAGYPNITSLSLPEGLEFIGESAFMLYQGEQLILPSTLEYLGEEAFLFATNVETLHIPVNLEYIGLGALSHMSSLTAITADPNNSSYKADGGVLYTKNGAELVLYPCWNGVENVVVPEGVHKIGDGVFWGKWTMKSVTLPSTLDVIGDKAFRVCMGLTEITIPEGVTDIGSYAFNSCDTLKTVNLPSSIKTIEQSAFARCAQLTTVNYAGEIDDWNSIYIGAGNDYLLDAYLGGGAAASGEWGDGLYWSVEGDTITLSGSGEPYDWGYNPPWKAHLDNIKHLVVESGVTHLGDFSYFRVETAQLPEGLVYIGRDAFCGFRGTSITLPSTLVTIDESAFCDAHNLTSIHLPAKVETVDAISFCRNYSLREITVDTNNPYIKSVDGALYTEDGTMLIVVPAGKTGTSYTVENDTEIINSNGLAYCTFENVVLPDTVTSIGTLAFRGCENLETVTIPAGITTIKSRAFRDCDNLTTVNFKGTEAQWENILANTKSDNNPLLLATTYLGDNSVYQYKNIPVTFHHHNGEITVGFYKYMPLSIGGVGGSKAPTGGGIELWFTDPELTQEWDMDRDIITGPIHLYSNTYVESAPSDEFTWSYDEDTYTLYINGSGDMPDYGQFGAPWYEDYQYRCTNLVIGNGITSISDYAFYNMMVNQVTLPEGLRSIGRDAFMAGANVTGGMNIPSTLVDIHPTAIVEIEGELTVSPDNPVFTYEDGMLFAQDDLFGKTLHCVTMAADEELVIPSGVNYIVELAAAYNYKLKKVTIPASVTEIQGRAFSSCLYLEEAVVLGNVNRLYYSTFSNCPNLKKVVLPASITKINNFVFDDTHEDLTIYFMGTEAQWDAIDVNMSQNTGLAEADIVFNYEYSVPANGTLTDTISWSLVDGVLTLTGTGATPDYAYGATNRPWQDYISDIKKIVVGEGITNIGNTTFKNVVNLEEVSLPSTLKTIGKYGFYNCRKLKTINLPEGLTSLDYQCFHQCASLEEVVIPASVTVIPEYAFYECNNIHIKLHSGITEIGNYAFWESYNGVIEFIGTEAQWDAITKGNSAIGSRVTIVFSAPKEGTLDNGMAWSLVDGVLTITGTGAMPDWTYGAAKPWDDFANSIHTIVVGEGITTVGSFAFFQILARNLTLPEGLTAINESAFIGFAGEEIALPSTLESLGANAFGGATSLTSVQLPAALTNMNPNAFDGCISLAEYTVAEGNTKYTAVDGILYENGGATLFRVPYNVDTVVIPESVTSLKSDAFTSTQVKTVLMKTTSLNSIAAMAFGKCTKLEEIHIPESVTSVEMYAFDQCTNLKTIYYDGWEEKWENISMAPGNDALNDAEVIYDCGMPHLVTVQQPAQGGHIEVTRDFLIDYTVPVGIIAATEENYKIKAIVVTDEEGTTKYTGKDYVLLESADGDVTVTAELAEIINVSGVIGDTEWTVENDLLRISSTTGLTEDFENAEDQPWHQYAEDIKHIDITENVTQLGKNLFAGLYNVENVYLPYTVTIIGEKAFADMGKIMGLEFMNEGVYVGPFAFSGTAMNEYYMPNGALEIGPDAYNGFTVGVFHIRDSVQTIGDNAFANITANAIIYEGTADMWSNISIGTGNEALEDVILMGEPTDGYFEDTGVNWYYDHGETLFVFGEGEMPDFASADEQPWAYLSPLIRQIVVDAGITHIGEYAFADMDYVERVRIFDTVETIGANAFRDSAVKYLLMPDTVTYIGENAFNGTQVESDTFFFTGPRDKFWDIDIEDGNDEISYPSHINAQPNADWITVSFDTGCDIEIEPVITVTGYNISQWSVPNPARNGYVITGWYTTPRYNGGPYNWETDLFYEDTTLFARWVKLTTTDDDLQEEPKMTGFKLFSMDWEEVGSTYTGYLAGEEGEVLFLTETEGFGDYYQFLNVKSSNTEIAEFNPMYNGYEYQIILKKAGTVTLTFTSIANPKLTKTVKLTVKKLADEVQITMPNAIEVYGEKISVLTAGQKFKPTIKWVGGEKWPNFEIYGYGGIEYDPATGYATVVAAEDGGIMIDAWVEGGPSLYAEAMAAVFAQKTPSIQMNETNIVLDHANESARSSGAHRLFVANGSDEYCPVYTISWTANENIVVLDPDGNEITSPYLGDMVYVASRNNNKASTTITFKAIDGSGKSAKVKVQTGVAVQQIWLSNAKGQYEDPIYIAKGKSVKLLADIAPATATVKTLKWTAWADENCTVPSDIVTVSAGKVTTKDVGEAYILAEATDGSENWVKQKIVVTDATAKVQIGDGTTKSQTIYGHDDDYACTRLPILVMNADGETDTVSQDVEITVTGTNAKYAYFSKTPEGAYDFKFLRSGTYTIKATAKDGSGKYATFKVTVQQHLFSSDGLTVKPPKGITTIDHNSNTYWVVKAGTTITPAVTFNGGQKAYAPSADAKKYTIEPVDFMPADSTLTPEQCFTITGTKVKLLQPGYYSFEAEANEPCDDCAGNVVEMFIKVIPTNGVDVLEDALIEFTANKGFRDEDGTTFHVVTGAKVKFTPTMYGAKMPIGVTTAWSAYVESTDTPVAISTSGELNLAGVAAGENVIVDFVLTDKADATNTTAETLTVKVKEKLAPTDIQLVVPTIDGYVPITQRTYLPSEDDIYAYVVTKGTVSDYDSYTFKSSNTKVLQIETHPDLYGFETILKIVGTGTSTITVTANDGSGVKQTFKVTVGKEAVSVKQISATATNITVSSGRHVAIKTKLIPTVAGQEVSYPMVKWTVSDENMLSLLDQDDYEKAELIVPVGTDQWTELRFKPLAQSGKVTITGTALDGSKKTVKITVNIVPEGEGKVLEDFLLTLPANAPDEGMNMPVLTWGKSLQIKATTMPSTVKQKALVWSVYAVDDDGNETPNPAGITVKDGKVTVAKASTTLTPYEGWIKVVAEPAVWGDTFNLEAQEMYIKVKAPLSKITITGADTLYPGAECQLTADMIFNASATVTDTDNYPILWSVNNTKLAEIDENGVLTIKEDAKVGSTVKVTAATQDGSGKKATVSIKIVKKPAVEISVDWMPQELVDLTTDAVEGECIAITDDCYYYVHHDYDVQNIVFTANRDVPGFKLFEMGYDSYENYLYEEWAFCEDFPLTNKISLAVRTYLGETVPLIGYSYIDEATDERVYFYMNIHGNTGEIMPRQFVPGEEWL